MAVNKACLVMFTVALWAINTVNALSCEGKCFPDNKCPDGFTSAGGPPGKCRGRKMKCCVAEPDRCALAGGECFPNDRCPDGYTSAPGPSGKCKGRKQKCCAPEKVLYANCAMRPNIGNSAQPVTGTVQLSQPVGGDLKFDVDLTGFDTSDSNSLHGFHAHVYGDISGGCGSAGGHFNPEGVTHGGPNDAIRHVGDFGNLKEDGSATIKKSFTDKLAKLSGPNSILGRALVLHAQEDDLGRGGNAGSLATGNAGPRLACCVVGLAKDPDAK